MLHREMVTGICLRSSFHKGHWLLTSYLGRLDTTVELISRMIISSRRS